MIDETAEEIREMQTHSSSVVAVKAATALRELLERDYATVEEFERTLERNSSALRRASRSHASLWTTQQEIVEAVATADGDDLDAVKAIAADAIDRVVDQIETAKRAAAANAADLLADGSTLLTHDYSTTVLAAIENALEAGRTLECYVTEARPRYLGRKTARHLGGTDGVTARLIVDGAAGLVLDECDRVFVGMDCIVEGLLYNRVGTYPLAATAADVGVPVHAVGSSAKLVEGGFRFENDFRSPSEVMREPAEGFEVYNPAYDATPTRLIESVVTDEGITAV